MQRLNDLPLSCKLQHLRASVSTCADTSRSLRAVSTGYASRPPACRAHLGRRAACPEGAPWVGVPASGVPCAPRTVAPQVSTRHARHPVCSDLRRRRVALDLLLASHSTLTELEQREIELLLQTQAWDEPPPRLKRDDADGPDAEPDALAAAHGVEWSTLLRAMVAAAPGARPGADEVCDHPVFWGSRQRLEFLNELKIFNNYVCQR